MDKRLLAKAIYDNVAETPSELAFKRGDVLTVVEQNLESLEGWWLCTFRGKQGLAPGNRLHLLAGMYSPSTLPFSPSSSSISSTEDSYRLSSSSAGVGVEYDVPRPHSNHRLAAAAEFSKGAAKSVYDTLPPSSAVKAVNQSTGQGQPQPTYDIPASSRHANQGTNPKQPDGGHYDVLPGSSSASSLSYATSSLHRNKNGAARALPSPPKNILSVGISHQRSRSNDEGGRAHPPHMMLRSLNQSASSAHGQVYTAVGGAGPHGNSIDYFMPAGTSDRSSLHSFVSSSSSPPESVTSGSVRSSAFDSDAYDIPQNYTTLAKNSARSSPQGLSKVPSVEVKGNGSTLRDYDIPKAHRLPTSPVPPPPTSNNNNSDGNSKNGHSNGTTVGSNHGGSASQALAASVIEDIYDKPVPSRKYLLQSNVDEVTAISANRQDYDIPSPPNTHTRDSGVPKTASLNSLHSNGDKSHLPSSTGSCDSLLETGHQGELCMEPEAALEYLGKAQEEMSTAASRLLHFQAPFWRTRDSLEPIVYDLKLSCLGMQSTLSEFLEFARGAEGSHDTSHDASQGASAMLVQVLQPLSGLSRSVDMSVKRLGAAKWSVSRLERKMAAGSGSLQQDDLDVLISAAQKAPKMVGSVVSILQEHAAIFFSKPTRSESGAASPSSSSTVRMERQSEGESLNNSESSLVVKDGHLNGSDRSDTLSMSSSVDEVSAEQSSVSENDRLYLEHYRPYVEDIRQGVSTAATKMLLCLAKRQANSEDPAGAQTFVALGKDVVTRAHRLVFIGETLSRFVEDTDIQQEVVDRANELCECLKSIIMYTKDAALGHSPQHMASQNLHNKVDSLNRIMATFTKTLAHPTKGFVNRHVHS